MSEERTKLIPSAGSVPMGEDRRTVPTRPKCAMCQRRITIDTDADDDLWLEVIGPLQGPGYVCADCFTREADERMIQWEGRLRFRPYSMASQLKIQEQVAELHSQNNEDRQ